MMKAQDIKVIEKLLKRESLFIGKEKNPIELNVTVWILFSVPDAIANKQKLPMYLENSIKSDFYNLFDLVLDLSEINNKHKGLF